MQVPPRPEAQGLLKNPILGFAFAKSQHWELSSDARKCLGALGQRSLLFLSLSLLSLFGTTSQLFVR